MSSLGPSETNGFSQSLSTINRILPVYAALNKPTSHISKSLLEKLRSLLLEHIPKLSPEKAIVLLDLSLCMLENPILENIPREILIHHPNSLTPRIIQYICSNPQFFWSIPLQSRRYIFEHNLQLFESLVCPHIRIICEELLFTDAQFDIFTFRKLPDINTLPNLISQLLYFMSGSPLLFSHTLVLIRRLAHLNVIPLSLLGQLRHVLSSAVGSDSIAMFRRTSQIPESFSQEDPIKQLVQDIDSIELSLKDPAPKLSVFTSHMTSTLGEILPSQSALVPPRPPPATSLAHTLAAEDAYSPSHTESNTAPYSPSVKSALQSLCDLSLVLSDVPLQTQIMVALSSALSAVSDQLDSQLSHTTDNTKQGNSSSSSSSSSSMKQSKSAETPSQIVEQLMRKNSNIIDLCGLLLLADDFPSISAQESANMREAPPETVNIYSSTNLHTFYSLFLPYLLHVLQISKADQSKTSQSSSLSSSSSSSSSLSSSPSPSSDTLSPQLLTESQLNTAQDFLCSNTIAQRFLLVHYLCLVRELFRVSLTQPTPPETTSPAGIPIPALKQLTVIAPHRLACVLFVKSSRLLNLVSRFCVHHTWFFSSLLSLLVQLLPHAHPAGTLPLQSPHNTQQLLAPLVTVILTSFLLPLLGHWVTRCSTPGVTPAALAQENAPGPFSYTALLHCTICWLYLGEHCYTAKNVTESINYIERMLRSKNTQGQTNKDPQSSPMPAPSPPQQLNRLTSPSPAYSSSSSSVPTSTSMPPPLPKRQRGPNLPTRSTTTQNSVNSLVNTAITHLSQCHAQRERDTDTAHLLSVRIFVDHLARQKAKLEKKSTNNNIDDRNNSNSSNNSNNDNNNNNNTESVTQPQLQEDIVNSRTHTTQSAALEQTTDNNKQSSSIPVSIKQEGIGSLTLSKLLSLDEFTNSVLTHIQQLISNSNRTLTPEKHLVSADSLESSNILSTPRPYIRQMAPDDSTSSLSKDLVKSESILSSLVQPAPLQGNTDAPPKTEDDLIKPDPEEKTKEATENLQESRYRLEKLLHVLSPQSWIPTSSPGPDDYLEILLIQIHPLLKKPHVDTNNQSASTDKTQSSSSLSTTVSVQRMIDSVKAFSDSSSTSASTENAFNPDLLDTCITAPTRFYITNASGAQSIWGKSMLALSSVANTPVSHPVRFFLTLSTQHLSSSIKNFGRLSNILKTSTYNTNPFLHK